MTRQELMDLIRSGEDSGTQFKADVRNAQSLASEMAAFSNSRGGEILIGVTDQGEALGLESGDVHRINQLISNAASQLVRSPLNVHTVNVLLDNDRVELISPGSLPNHLTVEKIRAGNSVIRNPILASFTAKGLLPYRGLGTGVRRALQECPALQFAHDPEAETFTATIPLTGSDETADEPVEIENEPVELENEPVEAGFEPVEPKNEPIEPDMNPLQVQLLNLINENPDITYDQMAEATGKGRSTIRRHIKALREKNLLCRVGSARHGHWERISETSLPGK